jgi:nitrogen fixation/metabolism regulation signal transduction histidine kinase
LPTSGSGTRRTARGDSVRAALSEVKNPLTPIKTHHIP